MGDIGNSVSKCDRDKLSCDQGLCELSSSRHTCMKNEFTCVSSLLDVEDHILHGNDNMLFYKLYTLSSSDS